ncbi:MAG: peptidase [Spirulina sp. SIO3F2]|nr:peptidase [Spirulina sp. SIO3F2]
MSLFKLHPSQKRWLWRLLFGAIALLIALTPFTPAPAQPSFPTPQAHPLPDFIQRLPQLEADYFAEIQTTPLGYLMWSHFPVTIYVQQPTAAEVEDKKFEKWLKSVDVAIADWQEYFPLVEISEPDNADITVLRQRPQRDIQVDRDNQRLIIPDARHGTARYEFYLTPTEPPLIQHRFTISLSPAQNAKHMRGTARHELGHALGLWGHSLDEDDVMYGLQVRRPPPISGRDLSVLRRVYEQPTQVGWAVVENSAS